MVKPFDRFLFLLTLVLSSTAHSLASSPVTNAMTALKPPLAHFQKRQILLHFTAQTSESIANSVGRFGTIPSSQISGYKSKGRAFLQSLILPGWGQYYARSHTMLKVFVASEVVLWGTYAGFTAWSNWLEDDYRTFAVTHAGVDLDGKSAGYFVDIGNFIDIAEYNQAQLRDRDLSALYPESEEFFWRWDSEANRRRFEDLRIRSDRASNRADLTVAMILVNHLVSAIQATLAVHHYNQRQASKDIGFNIEVDGYAENRRVTLTLFKNL